MTDIKTMLAPKGSMCRSGYFMKPEYITIHNTANTSKGAGAKAHGAYLQGGGAKKAVSYHYAVDDKIIVQIIPDSEVAWHAGDGGKGTGNRKSIGIEICENPESNLRDATDSAAMLCAILMQQYGIVLQNVVQHHHWSGKNCPNRIRKGEPYDWMTFIAKVSGFAAALQAPSAETDGTLYTVQTGAFGQKQNAQNYVETLRKKGVEAFITPKEG
ncbi:MAG: N-acetylmuramoyl-L-alanine amidase [Ruthenibacterium sp.]